MSKSRSKTDVPVGTKFMYRNVMLEVIEERWCNTCYFTNRKKYCDPVKCLTFERTDKKQVIFKQIPITNE